MPLDGHHSRLLPSRSLNINGADWMVEKTVETRDCQRFGETINATAFKSSAAR